MSSGQVDKLLSSLVKEEVSDLHFKTGSPPLLRVKGELVPANFRKLSPQDTEVLAKSLLTQKEWESFQSKSEYDTSYSVTGISRFRVNMFRQRGSIALVFRIIPYAVPSINELGLPEKVKELALEPRGLILVTGITGSGKSTTLASMINYINNTKKAHIITIEDPIEFLYEDKLCSINQREVGKDTENFTTALRAALRQDPDIILVGEMRDVETISIAIKAAETGHLVMSTLHTTDAASTINRIIDSFPPHQQFQVRLQLAANIRGIISQRLLPRKDGKGRIIAVELLVSTKTIQAYIEEPEKTALIKDMIEAGRSQYGMQSFDQALTELYNSGKITLETALSASDNPADFKRALLFE
jgi:twitching motility protein PilT